MLLVCGRFLFWAPLASGRQDSQPTHTPIRCNSVRDNAALAAKLPFLSKVLVIQSNFLPEAHATQLLMELRTDVRANWRPEKRVVAGREIEPKRRSLIVHDTGRGDGDHDGFVNQSSPLLQSPAFLGATRAVEEYINREKHQWPEYHLYKNERWEGACVRACI